MTIYSTPSKHKFPYRWTLADAVFTKDKGKVFSCFACGGGSTMGYKLAGFDVIGCNEIDPKMIAAYRANHNPKHSYLEPIQTFKNREDLPPELFDLDILDGSPPCSSFSMAGNREKDWGKEKKFREGQAEQVLDTLFFDFIDLAERLQPKVVVAENVKGLLMGDAIHYVRRIYEAFDRAGYECQHFLLDASKMGVPQRRERVFFVALRKNLAAPFMEQVDMFTQRPTLDMEFDEAEIPFGEVDAHTDNNQDANTTSTALKYWHLTKPGDSFSSVANGSFFNWIRLNSMTVANTIPAQTNYTYHSEVCRPLNRSELCQIGSYPKDYDFLSMKPVYLIGMSVPPVMTAQVATRIHEQWLSKINA
jgi:DNA (cytosine-5)-methyltransferase 1